MPITVNCIFMSGKSIYVKNIAGYFEIPLVAHLFARCGLLQKCAHVCTATDMFGRVDP